MRIKVTPEELRVKANQITDEINAIRRDMDHISGIFKAQKGYWEGDASDTNSKEFDKLNKSVERKIYSLTDNPQNLLRMAGVYVSTINTVKEAENTLPEDVII